MTLAALSHAATAQPSVKPAIPSSYCNYETALQVISQQIDATKSFDDTTQRITVLLRAADLLWPHQSVKSRTAFKEALDLACINFKHNRNNPDADADQSTNLTLDDRYRVLAAIARRDQAWAMKLAEQMILNSQKEEGDSTKVEDEVGTASKLLETALLLLPSNVNAGITFAIINGLKSPDFSNHFVIRKIVGKTFGAYAVFEVPGLNPENTLGELARFDFDAAFYQTSSFADKQLRALTILTLAQSCLDTPQKSPKDRRSKQDGF